MNSFSKQSGMSLFLMMFIFVVVAMALLLSFKVVPHYMEYQTVKKAILSTANSEAGRSGTVSEIRKAFERSVAIDNIKSVSNTDLEISKDGNETVISASWSAKIKLAATWTLVIDFTASSNEKD